MKAVCLSLLGTPGKVKPYIRDAMSGGAEMTACFIQFGLLKSPETRCRGQAQR